MTEDQAAFRTVYSVKLASGCVFGYNNIDNPHELDLLCIYNPSICRDAQKVSEILSAKYPQGTWGDSYITYVNLIYFCVIDPYGTLVIPKNLSEENFYIHNSYRLSCLVYVQGIHEIPKSTYGNTPYIDYLQIQDPSAYFSESVSPPIIVNSGYILNSSYLKQDPYNIKEAIYSWSTYNIKAYYRDENGNLIQFPR